MNPLAGLYAIAVKVRNRLYDRGMLPVGWLQGPVVSIGNIAVGGAGKTPFLILLGNLLKQRGVKFDVLSRGYGRATKGVALVDPEGSAREFGDEPLLIARRLKVPVVVGENRYAAGKLAEEKFGPQLHLLDDGFQHRELGRDFDIVLVRDRDPQDLLLPAGRLREPLSSLKRANAVVLTNHGSPDGLKLGEQAVWRVLRGIAPLSAPGPCLAFCGIARPAYFFAQLKAAGITLAGTRAFRDHHPYTEADIRELLQLRQQHNATAFVTTEKDAINLGARTAELEPLLITQVTMELEDAEAALATMRTAFKKQKPAAP